MLPTEVKNHVLEPIIGSKEGYILQLQTYCRSEASNQCADRRICQQHVHTKMRRHDAQQLVTLVVRL
jgi:hypothetical protein